VGCVLALGLAVAVVGTVAGAVADEAGPLPPAGSPAGRGLALVQPASPAPVTAALASSRNSRRSIGTSRRYPLPAARRGRHGHEARRGRNRPQTGAAVTGAMWH
jgi:hypothetical protein